MNRTTNIVNTYSAYLKASSAMGAALEDALRGQHLTAATVAELAEVHCAHYGAYMACAESGAYRFYTSEEAISANRHEAAQKQWNRTIAKYHKVKADGRGGSRNKIDPAEKFMAAFHKLDATTRRAVIKMLKGEGAI